MAQVGIAGSTVLEDLVQVAGRRQSPDTCASVGARIGAQAGAMSDVPAGAALVGSPARPRREFFRRVAVLERMARGRG